MIQTSTVCNSCPVRMFLVLGAILFMILGKAHHPGKRLHANSMCWNLGRQYHIASSNDTGKRLSTGFVETRLSSVKPLIIYKEEESLLAALQQNAKLMMTAFGGPLDVYARDK
ncbi:hypothetical protein L6452_13758 [Arctium lappa]|uniref:Uncharacterized protein n=1 Tax=Arctium lappa TaxID=4217 RepID=A0ACB9CJ64_ARCLA|nr:hypothetical protein L6452_13758 [Arctium lappa]